MGVPGDSAIARFYAQVFGAPSRVEDNVASFEIGSGQNLHFRERDDVPDHGHHIAIYIANFSRRFNGWKSAVWSPRVCATISFASRTSWIRRPVRWRSPWSTKSGNNATPFPPPTDQSRVEGLGKRSGSQR